MREAGNSSHDYLTVGMKDVIISNVHAAASREHDATAEHVTLQFADIDVEYRLQNADGAPDAGVHFRYDIRNNKEG